MYSMLKSIKIAAVDAVESTDPCKVMFGRVTGTSPVTVRVEDRLVLKEKQLAFLEGSGILAEGDMVTLLRVQGGQQFVVLGRVGEPKVMVAGWSSSSQWRVTENTYLNEEPISSAKTLARLSAGTVVSTVSGVSFHPAGPADSRDWRKVKYEDLEGWVPAPHLERIRNVELLTTAQVAAIATARTTRTLIDLNTRKSFNISWAASANYHTDWSPMTSADTDVIKSILNPEKSPTDSYWNSTSSWSWDARPGVLVLGDRNIAVGFHLRPHGKIQGGATPGLPLRNAPEGDVRPSGGWTMGGHMCMYYHDSVGGTQDCNLAAREAHKRGL